MFQVTPELLGELVAVRALHDEYQIRPLEQLGRYLFARRLVQPSGCNLDARPLGENLFRGGTSQLVPATYEEHVTHGFISSSDRPVCGNDCRVM